MDRSETAPAAAAPRVPAARTARDVLGRIAHDAAFRRGAAFEAGYYDRVADRVFFAPLSPDALPSPLRGRIALCAPDGAVASVPLHRLRVIRRNGQTIWSRPGAARKVTLP